MFLESQSGDSMYAVKNRPQLTSSLCASAPYRWMPSRGHWMSWMRDEILDPYANCCWRWPSVSCVFPLTANILVGPSEKKTCVCVWNRELGPTPLSILQEALVADAWVEGCYPDDTCADQEQETDRTRALHTDTALKLATSPHCVSVVYNPSAGFSLLDSARFLLTFLFPVSHHRQTERTLALRRIVLCLLMDCRARNVNHEVPGVQFTGIHFRICILDFRNLSPKMPCWLDLRHECPYFQLSLSPSTIRSVVGVCWTLHLIYSQ